MNAAEDWLYNEGFEATKKEYSAKLDDLRAISNLIEFRCNETTSRPPAIEALKKQIDMCKQFAQNYEESKSHITSEERDKVRKETEDTENWMYDMIGKQGDLRTYQDPVLTSESITNRRNTLFKNTKGIMTKPKPAPTPVETPPPAPSPAEAKSESKTPPPDASEPMDQSKGGPDSKADEK